MAQIKVYADGFQLVSPYACKMFRLEDYNGARELIFSRNNNEGTTEATRVSHTVRFDYAGILPADATITSAKVYATLGASTYGDEVSTVNGVHADPGNVEIAVPLADDLAPVDVIFAFQSKTPEHRHEFVQGVYDSREFGTYDDYDGSDDSAEYYWAYRWNVNHEGVRNYTDVYLLIEYTPAFTPPELLPYTDPRPVAGETYARAVHMTELHANVNRVREAYKLPAHDFPAITAMESLLARWNANVVAIRAALDAIGVAHEEWLVLGDNRPRLDVLLQLRRVVAMLAAGEDDPNAVGERFFTTDGELLTTDDGLYFRVLEGTANG